MLYDLPLFILTALSSGPYGPEVTAKISQINKYYETYYGGADFDVDDSDKDFDHTIWKSKKIKRLIDKQAEFMAGRAPEIKVSCDDSPEDCENQSNMQKYLNKVLSKNNFQSKLYRGVKDCFIGGRVFLKVNVTPDKITITFIPADSFLYETEPDDVDTLSRVIIFYCVNDTQDKEEQRWWRQRYRMENGKCLVVEELYDGYGNKIPGYGTEERDTGLTCIPGCVILNDGLSGDTNGESDVEMIEDEDSTYNQIRSGNNDVLLKNMNPVNYIIGASPKTFDKLSRKPGAINDIQADPILKGTLPKVDKLENSFSFRESYKDTLESVTAEMFDNLGVPDLRAAATSGLVTSGKGLKCLYWPLQTRCNAKWTAWGPALEQMASIIIDSAEIFPELKQVYGEFGKEDYTVHADPVYALPEDEDSERELDLREVGTGRSIKSYLMKWGGPNHTGLSAEKADDEIKQMALEKQMMESAAMGEMDGVEDFGGGDG